MRRILDTERHFNFFPEGLDCNYEKQPLDSPGFAPVFPRNMDPIAFKFLVDYVEEVERNRSKVQDVHVVGLYSHVPHFSNEYIVTYMLKYREGVIPTTKLLHRIVWKFGMWYEEEFDWFTSRIFPRGLSDYYRDEVYEVESEACEVYPSHLIPDVLAKLIFKANEIRDQIQTRLVLSDLFMIGSDIHAVFRYALGLFVEVKYNEEIGEWE